MKKKPKTLFNSLEFSQQVRMKIYNEVYKQQRRIPLHEFAKEIGISAATLSRVERGNMPDVETFFKVCQWMKAPMSIFINV